AAGAVLLAVQKSSFERSSATALRSTRLSSSGHGNPSPVRISSRTRARNSWSSAKRGSALSAGVSCSSGKASRLAGVSTSRGCSALGAGRGTMAGGRGGGGGGGGGDGGAGAGAALGAGGGVGGGGAR